MDFDPSVLYSNINLDLCESDARFTFGDNVLQDIPIGSDVRLYAFGHLLSSVVKKFQRDDPETKSRRELLALDKFIESNDACGIYNYSNMMDGASSWVETCSNEAILEIERLLEDWLGPRFTWTDVYQKGYFPSGASVGVKFTDEYAKRTDVRSCTRKSVYQQWLADTADDLGGVAEVIARLSGNTVVIDDCSSTSTVLKNAEIDRTICTEPSLNMYYQLGLGTVLRDLLRVHFDIDLPNQQAINRELARRGSVTEQFATIDLSSASDTISLSLCKAVLPSWLYDLLVWLRCGWTRLPNGKRVQLHMVSSMGNGYTFPLQTMLFCAIVRAAYKVCGLPTRGASAALPNFGVNGDDIVIDVRAYNLVVEVLTRWGFTVNSAKTFREGPFRESCGGDYFNGHYVRGVYIKSIDTPQDVISAVNRLVEWSARWHAPLSRSVSYLLSLVKSFPLVPRWEDDTAGLKVPLSYITYVALTSDIVHSKRGLSYHYRGRYHPCFGVSNPRKRGNYYNDTILYKHWRPRTPFRPIENDGVVPNEAGYILVAIAGKTQCGSVAVALKQGTKPQYRSRVGAAPDWEQHIDPRWQDLTIPAVGRARWISAFTACVKM